MTSLAWSTFQVPEFNEHFRPIHMALSMCIEFVSFAFTCKSFGCTLVRCSSNEHSFNPHRVVDWKWTQSESWLKCVGKDGSHAIQFLPIPHPTPRGASEESQRTAKYWQDVWRVDSCGNKSAEGSPFPSSSSTRDYHAAKNCHAYNSHRITSPQLLIWMCTMRIEFALPRMRVQREFNAHWRKVSCEWAFTCVNSRLLV